MDFEKFENNEDYKSFMIGEMMYLAQCLNEGNYTINGRGVEQLINNKINFVLYKSGLAGSDGSVKELKMQPLYRFYTSSGVYVREAYVNDNFWLRQTLPVEMKKDYFSSIAKPKGEEK
jgi:hypothetical protein